MTTRLHSTMMVVLAIAGMAAIALADIPEPADPTESDFASSLAKAQWVRRVAEASELLGTDKAAEALAAFEALQQEMPAQDTDGMVALAIGDCRFHLKQYDKARGAYEQALQLHPDLADTVWIRLVEADLAAGRLDDATRRLQQVVAGDAPADQKAWACRRLGNVQEVRAIQLLNTAEQTYRQASGILEGLLPAAQQRQGGGWCEGHADDLKDASSQLQAALERIMGGNTPMPVFWRGPWQGVDLPAAELGKVRISGQVSRVEAGKDAKVRPQKDKDGKETVELVIDKDGKIDVTLGGRKVDLDAAAQRQIRNHLQHTLRLAGQASHDTSDPKAAE